MKGNISIFVIVGLVAVVAIGFAVYKMFPSENAAPSPSPTYQSLSEDPKYQEVKEKYNLSEEQLQIRTSRDGNVWKTETARPEPVAPPFGPLRSWLPPLDGRSAIS